MSEPLDIALWAASQGFGVENSKVLYFDIKEFGQDYMANNNYDLQQRYHDEVAKNERLLRENNELRAALEDRERRLIWDHQQLMDAAEKILLVMDYVRSNQKINAIYQLRSVTHCSLREAKNAIEALMGEQQW